MINSGEEQSNLKFKLVISVIIVALAAILFVLPAPEGVSQKIMQAGGLTLFVIGFWATATWPIGVTAIAFFFIAAVFSIQPVEVVFSGFTSPALWLIFGGLAIGVSVSHTRLGERLARSFGYTVWWVLLFGNLRYCFGMYDFGLCYAIEHGANRIIGTHYYCSGRKAWL